MKSHHKRSYCTLNIKRHEPPPENKMQKHINKTYEMFAALQTRCQGARRPEEKSDVVCCLEFTRGIGLKRQSLEDVF